MGRLGQHPVKKPAPAPAILITPDDSSRLMQEARRLAKLEKTDPAAVARELREQAYYNLLLLKHAVATIPAGRSGVTNWTKLLADHARLIGRILNGVVDAKPQEEDPQADVPRWKPKKR